MKRILSLILLIAILLLSIQETFALWTNYDGHDPVHQYVNDTAIQIYQFDELVQHLSYVNEGARHEDLKDHVYDRYGIGDYWITISHFWDADLGPNDLVDMVVVGDNCPNAWQKAQDMWAIALGEYAKGDLAKAYEAFGHVTHLLADMSVPAHIHEDMHATDMYEDWMEFPSAYLSELEKDSIIAKGPVRIPEDVTNPLEYLFYTTNQVADWFPSDNDNGDTATTGIPGATGWMINVYDENRGFFNGTPQRLITTPRITDDLDSAEALPTIRNYCYSYGIRAVATLFRLFEEAISGRNYLTVIIDEVDAQDPHEDPDWGADFFAEVSINEDWFRNKGDQIIDIDHIHPHWAYGKSVGLTGQVSVCIQIYDEDDDPDADDKTDLDPKDGPRDVDIVVDLATGAISGDVSGMCGDVLTIAGEGNQNDYSQVWFRVILPNIPPTAHAGDDQTVNEGDTVTLNGTFEDPNTEDTHTLIWHLKNASNGQYVPDSTTSSLTFVPNDNGTYVFTYTVTDNYGASGSDEVVITVNNVAPVASIDHLKDETDAEIGTDVPVALINLPVYLTGSFTDAGSADTHAATIIDWGDTTSNTVFDLFTDSTGGVTGLIGQQHIYSVPGVMTITLEVTDDDGGIGTDTAPITIVDAAGAMSSAIDMLVSDTDNPYVKAAIDRLQGEKDRIAANGGLDMLDQNAIYAALEMIRQTIACLDMAEAYDADLDLTYVKGLLALAAKSIVIGAIQDAEVLVVKANHLKKIQQAKALVLLGDEALASSLHLVAVGKYQEAFRAILGIV